MLKIRSIAFPIFLSLALSACGGGGGDDTAANQRAEEQRKAAEEKAIRDAAQAVLDSMPPAKVFVGAYTSINGVANGYTAGTSPEGVVMALARTVQQNQAAYPELYRLLVSDAGLKVVVFGEQVGKSSINGMPIYAADRVYVAALKSDGLHVVFVGNAG